MFVPCPHCQFLVAHHPQLRPLPHDCPRCGRPLADEGEGNAAAGNDDGTGDDAREAGIDPAAPAHEPSLAAAGDDADAAALAAFDATAALASGSVPTGHADLAGNGDGPAAATPAAFARPHGARHALARWSWPLLAVLGLLLALQVLLADRTRLAAEPRWRPLLESLCGALRCELPPWHEPAAFTMLDRKVQPGPTPGTLRVDATFRNDARWTQAWPALQLALSDADGRVLGSQVFGPADYLGAAPATQLSPGQSAQITFLVQEPAPGTVAFSFEFR